LPKPRGCPRPFLVMAAMGIEATARAQRSGVVAEADGSWPPLPKQVPENYEDMLSCAYALQDLVRVLDERMTDGEQKLQAARSQIPTNCVSVDTEEPADIVAEASALEEKLALGKSKLAVQEQSLRTISKAVHSIAQMKLMGETGDAGAAMLTADMLGHSVVEGSVPAACTVPLPGPKLTTAFPAEEDAPDVLYPSLKRDGQQASVGSVRHPKGCVPCRFYAFIDRGCKKGASCIFCHMLHVTRSSRRLPRRSVGGPESAVASGGGGPGAPGSCLPASSDGPGLP